MNRSKQLWIEATFFLLLLAMVVGGLYGTDNYLRRKYSEQFGINQDGYRGVRLGKKEPGEFRIAFLGGSLAFGYGVGLSDSLPFLLENELNKNRSPATLVRVANLAFNTERTSSFQTTLQDYRFLDYDLVILMGGYSDMASQFEHKSPGRRYNSLLYRLTGYYPLLPTIFTEKLMAIKFGGDLRAAYAGGGGGVGRVVFSGGNEGNIEKAVEEIRRVRGTNAIQAEAADLSPSRTATASCGVKWHNYCQWMYEATQVARRKGAVVFVVGEPSSGETHAEQQRALERLLVKAFGEDPSVHYLSMGRAVDSHDRTLFYDGAHLTRKGADRLVTALGAAIYAELK